MTPENELLIKKRKASFGDFFQALMPTLVDFVEKMGVNPGHEVLKHAAQFVPYLNSGLQNITVADEQDRIWLLTRMGYFIGEYFVQKYGGCWYLNEIPGSRYFGKYVVGKFSSLSSAAIMLDPFEVAQAYVDTPVPRQLEPLLKAIEAELVGNTSH